MEKLKNKSGITLIGLVATIIVLLILAGVAINLAIGENGLFNQSKLAMEKYKIAANEEEKQLQWNTIVGDNTGRGDGTETGTVLEELNRLKAEVETLKTSKANAADVISLQSELSTNYMLKSATLNGTRDLLWNTGLSVPTTTSFTERDYNIVLPEGKGKNQYKYLEINTLMTSSSGSCYLQTTLIATDQLEIHNSDEVSWSDGSTFAINNMPNWEGVVAAAWFKDNRTIHIGYSVANNTDWLDITIKSIYGIN